jgi:hypothetical protein
MRGIKLGIGALLAALAFSAAFGFESASATALYSGGTKLGAGTEIQSSLTGSASFTDLEGHTLDTCTGSTTSGKTETAGSSTSTVTGKIAAANLTWSGCTVATSTTEGGGFEWHWIAGTWNATVTWTGFKISINSVLFGNCVYSAGTATHLGTFKGVTVAGAVAKFIFSALLKKVAGLCNNEAKFVAEYNVTSPSPLHVTGS